MKKKIKLITLMLTLVLLLVGCSKEKEEITEPIDKRLVGTNSCVGCHTNYEALKILADPDTATTGGGGCGGDAPHYDPWDRVHLGGSGAVNFLNSSHGKKGCTYCHNGVDNTGDKNKAHSNNFINNPSSVENNKCQICHPSIYRRFENSLHAQGWGQKKRISLRAGLNSFDQLPDITKKGYDKNCGKCHATCSECHISRPVASGDGLLWGHEFKKTPNIRENCTACHVSRGGHAYFGEGIGTLPDVHLTKLGNGHCINCHTKNELHGDGVKYEQRYSMALLPKCENCHTGLATSNKYHSKHINDLSCSVCHSQNYNNCGNCHVGSGARIPSYQGFKIGMNPIPQIKKYKYAVLRQSPGAPDAFSNWGIANFTNFDAEPTYKYATPHSNIKWTSRTKVESGKACYDNCHIIDGRNKEIYLFRSDLRDWEVNANNGVVVDGKLPVSWNQ